MQRVHAVVDRNIKHALIELTEKERIDLAIKALMMNRESRRFGRVPAARARELPWQSKDYH
ncbi:MAG: hypothetical protein ACYC7D_08740 [Nitrososphaerales archaeon]